MVKVTLQSNKALRSQLPSTWSVTREILREHGFGSRGLNKGLTATIARNGVFNMVYFGFYHSVKGYVPEYEVSNIYAYAYLCSQFRPFGSINLLIVIY